MILYFFVFSLVFLLFFYTEENFICKKYFFVNLSRFCFNDLFNYKQKLCIIYYKQKKERMHIKSRIFKLKAHESKYIYTYLQKNKLKEF